MSSLDQFEQLFDPMKEFAIFTIPFFHLVPNAHSVIVSRRANQNRSS